MTTKRPTNQQIFEELQAVRAENQRLLEMMTKQHEEPFEAPLHPWKAMQLVVQIMRRWLPVGGQDVDLSSKEVRFCLELLETIGSCELCGGMRVLANGMECNRCAGKGLQSLWDIQRNRTHDSHKGR